MPRKPKFRPMVTRVKLNPEQAVLACHCYNGYGYYDTPRTGAADINGGNYCLAGAGKGIVNWVHDSGGPCGGRDYYPLQNIWSASS